VPYSPIGNGQQSCTAGRAAFITGQSPIRTGLTKVGLPGADVGLRPQDPTIAEYLKAMGYATGQFGKNHLGDKDEFLPTNHGFDEFFGNLYHLNAERRAREFRLSQKFQNLKKDLVHAEYYIPMLEERSMTLARLAKKNGNG
jgi:arylsulfatase A-like enzyme